MDINGFKALGISETFIKSLMKQGIKEPTPIQEKAIPLLLEGKDVIAQAQTGTGKTFAFMLPMMEKINPEFPFVQGLVITPTRELALQIKNEADKLARGRGISVLAVYGGQDVEAQIRKLKKKAHIVVGTPGRLIDHIRRGTLNFCRLNTLVLDEADQMLDMGFLPDVEVIISNITSPSRQTLLFSATIPKTVSSLAKKLMVDPVTVHARGRAITLDEIRQMVVETTDRQKQASLFKVLDETQPFLAIAFCRTKRRASTLTAALINNGYNADELHGDLSQAKRERVMDKFRKAKIQILVATDVAARGLDVEGVTHIFNYDIPQDLESYIHRIGRTGRAGEKGVAITFSALKDKDALRKIEEGINAPLERYPLMMELDIEKSHKDKSGYSKDQGKPNYKGKRDFGGDNKGRGKDRGKGKGKGRGKDHYQDKDKGKFKDKGKDQWQDKDKGKGKDYNHKNKNKGKSFGGNKFNDKNNTRNDGRNDNRDNRTDNRKKRR